MATHQNDCDVCTQISQIIAGAHPRFVAELPTGYVVMGPNQYCPGYCVLLCKEPATELSELEAHFRTEFLADMAFMAEVIGQVTQAHKLNYEALGNICHHLHWHVFPRQLTEAFPLEPVWKLNFSDPKVAYEEEKHGQLRQVIRALLVEGR